MFRYAIPAAAAALGLIAAAQPGATRSEPPLAQGMGWHLSHEGPAAKLAYGLANSDQLALMMVCEPGQSQAVIYGEVQPASPRLIQASTGPAEIDPLSGGLLQEARISMDDPTLRRLLDRGTLAVESETGRFQLTANQEERSLVGAFFAWCGVDQA
jgi:hypothetical protein